MLIASALSSVPFQLAAANFADLVQGFSTAFAGVAAIAAFAAARSTRDAAQETVIEQRKAATLAYVQENRERYRTLRSEIGHLESMPSEDSEAHARLLNLLELWEHQAAGLNDGAFDLEVFNKMTGGYLLNVYRQYSPWIRVIRRDDPAIYDQLETLVDRLILMRASGYRVDRRTIRELSRDGLERSDLKRLKKLKRKNEYSYVELQNALIEHRIERFKNRVTKVCRVVIGSIEPYDPRFRAEVVSLFVAVQSDTHGAYPPKALIESYYPPGPEGIGLWLDRADGNHRFVLVASGTGQVIAHIELEPLGNDMSEEQRQYWSTAFASQDRFRAEGVRLDDLVVLKRLGVHPDWQRRDAGRLLLRHAIHEVEFVHRRVPALVVIESLAAARSLYESEGGQVVGSFNEPTGERLISYIF